MAIRRTVTAALVAATAALTVVAPALAQSGGARLAPGRSDLDLCHREALAAIGGSASPGTHVAPRPGPSTGSSTVIGSGARGAAGATGGTGALSDGSTLGSRSTAGDPALPGVAPGGGSNDPVYQHAYRECLRRRGF